MIETPNESWQDATGMRQRELKLRVAIQHSAKNQMASGNCCVQGKGNEIWEGVGLQALAAYGRCQRMQKNRQIKRLDARENGFEERIVEIAAVDISTHINAAHTRELV